MKVLTMASQKGGSGKTTIAASLAVAASQAGESVVVVDLDPQGSLGQWGKAREADDIIFRAVRPRDLDRWMSVTRGIPAVTLVLLDTAGIFSDEVLAAIGHANLVLVPVRPSALDLRAVGPTVEHLHKVKRPFAFVLNGVSAITQGRTADAIEVLKVGGEVAPTLGERLDYRDAAATGLGVTELSPRGKAASEISALWDYVRGRLDHG